MGLIDRTYFIAELLVPNAQIDNNPAAVELALFIEKYEKQFLRYALGHELYTALKAGLLEIPVAQRWQDLVGGVEYQDQGGFGYTWKGLAPAADIVTGLNSLTPIFAVVGRGAFDYDPEPGTVALIPDGLVGKAFTLEQRGLGTLEPETEYTVENGNEIHLQNSVFSNGNTYVYRTSAGDYTTTPGTAKESPIAMYVYFFWQQNRYTQSGGVGEVTTSNENAVVANPGAKMTRAWNEMSEWVKDLIYYLNTKREVYPEWTTQRIAQAQHYFGTVNEFGI